MNTGITSAKKVVFEKAISAIGNVKEELYPAFLTQPENLIHGCKF